MEILVVEKDPSSSALLKFTLESLGHEVIEASSCAQAWDCFLHGEVSLVISDWLRPGLDGLELCRRVRRARRPRYTYFILLTTMGGKDSYLQGMKAGADDFITKPFDPDQLGARLVVAERILSLQADVKRLEGLLPICSYCRKIRDDQNDWSTLEAYVSARTDAAFTHSICPDCYESTVRPELEEMQREARR